MKFLLFVSVAVVVALVGCGKSPPTERGTVILSEKYDFNSHEKRPDSGASGQMKSDQILTKQELANWIETKRGRLIDTIVADAAMNIKTIEGEIFGYAFIPGDVGDLVGIVVAYALVGEGPAGTDDETFFLQHSPNEWGNYPEGVYVKSNELIAAMETEFKQRHVHRGEEFVSDEIEIAYSMHIFEILDTALEKIKKDVLPEGTFVTLWLPDSFNHEVVLNSIRRHNSTQTYQRMEECIPDYY